MKRRNRGSLAMLIAYVGNPKGYKLWHDLYQKVIVFIVVLFDKSAIMFKPSSKSIWVADIDDRCTNVIEGMPLNGAGEFKEPDSEEIIFACFSVSTIGDVKNKNCALHASSAGNGYCYSKLKCLMKIFYSLSPPKGKTKMSDYKVSTVRWMLHRKTILGFGFQDKIPKPYLRTNESFVGRMF